jgi:hypothetical protein
MPALGVRYGPCQGCDPPRRASCSWDIACPIQPQKPTRPACPSEPSCGAGGSSRRLCIVNGLPIEREEVVALLFTVNDISVTLEKIRRLLAEEDDDGEEEEEADAG